MYKQAGAAAAIIVAGGIALTGCHSNGSVADAAHGTAAATAAANYAPIIDKCGVKTAAGQLIAVKDLGSKTGRDALMAKCGVPKQNRQAAIQLALQAAETGHLTKGHAYRVTYFTVTLPGIIQKEQA